MGDFIAELKRRNVLRVGAAYLVGSWLILQFVDVVFPMLGLDESLGRPILTLLLLGFPVALILAWVFELTPEGLKKEKDIDRSNSVTPETGRKLDRIIIVILVFALGLLLVDKFMPESPPGSSVAESQSLDSVAVLPFVNLSGAAENEYFSDGLTETLLHMLAQVPELKVAARTSVFAFKGKDEDVRHIADTLGVATILEGSVQRAGNKVRITAQLIEAESGFHLWSETFDRDLDDIFAVQDEIASSVAGALRATLLGESPAESVQLAGVGTTNAAAYEKYLLGLEQKNIASYGSLPRAEGLFKDALALDPRFIEAKVQLAQTYEEQADTGLIARDMASTRIRPLLEQVLDANPEHGLARAMLAWNTVLVSVGETGVVPGLLERVRDEIRAGIASSPNEPAPYAMMAQTARMQGQFEQALEWFDRGLERDPLSADLYWQRGTLLLTAMEDPERAEASYARARELAPEWTAVYAASANAARAGGDFAGSLRWNLRAMELDPRDHELPASIGSFYYRLGLLDEGDAMLDRAQALSPEAAWTRSLEVQGHFIRGNYERTVLVAEDMIRSNIANRGDAWSNALTSYVASKIHLGRVTDINPFFESVSPGVTDPEYRATSINENLMRAFVVLAYSVQGAYDHANQILDPLVDWFTANVPMFEENHGAQLMIALARGDLDAAADHALQDLEGPLSENMNWANYRRLPWLEPLTRDERVAARLAELEGETESASNEVRQFLADESAAM